MRENIPHIAGVAIGFGLFGLAAWKLKNKCSP